MAKEQSVSAAAEKPVRANKQTRTEHPAQNFVSVYANDVNMLMTPWDFRLRFGQIDNVDPAKNTAEITVLADVRLSPQHVKTLVRVLTGLVEAYENSVGPIPQPGDGD